MIDNDGPDPSGCSCCCLSFVALFGLMMLVVILVFGI